MKRVGGFVAVVGSIAIAACVAVVAGCGKSSSSGGSAPAPEHPTYYKDVAPILNSHCVACHVAGSIAPFALDSYAGASAQALGIKNDTGARIMPPWGPVADGSCQTWKDPRWLSETEITTLARWADDGAPAGDVVPTPTPLPKPELAHVDATIDMGGSYTPSGATQDVYRCFVIDPGFTSNVYITGYHVYPGARDIVHHVILYSVSDQGYQEAQAKDAQDADLGYTCFGTSGVSGEQWTAAWAPGGDVGFYPDTTGVEVKAGQKLVLQVHYNLAAGPKPDDTHIDLQLESSVPKPAYVVPIPNQDFSLPKGEASISDTATFSLAQLPFDVNLWGLGPHMHLLGRQMDVSLIDGNGNEKCMLHQPHYEFRWQQLYEYAQPQPVTPQDSLKITCTWDTTNAVNDPTTWGDGTTDEMCLAVAYITL